VNYTFIDFETTGLNQPIGTDQIIEVALVKAELGSDEVLATQFFVQLEGGRKVSEFITGLTGITAADLATPQAFPLDEATQIIAEFVKGSTIVAQWAPFDLSFLPELLNDFYCTRSLSYLLHHENPSLIPVCKDLGIPLSSAHRAMSDALATKAVFEKHVERVVDILNYKNVVVDTDRRPLTWIPHNTIVLDYKTGGNN
jgi:DNA polymerase III epsilon subunit-like protein